MADSSDEAGPSRRDKGKAVVEDDDDHQTQTTNVLFPTPLNTIMPEEQEGYHCLSVTLNSNDTNPMNPVLFLDGSDAYALTDSQDVIDPPSASYSTVLPVFDRLNNYYGLRLSLNEDRTGYFVTEDWRKFVLFHRLTAGDKISFFRILDKDVCDGYHYTLTYVKKSIGVEDDIYDVNVSEVKDDEIPQNRKRVFEDISDSVQVENPPGRKMKPGPGSRDLTPQAFCFAKILSASEVDRANAKLNLDNDEVKFLTGRADILDYPFGTLSMNLLVYDVKDEHYDMLLSHSKSVRGEIIYTIDSGWKRFVKKNQLKAGDEIIVYRILDERVYDEYYYIIKFSSKGPWDPVIGKNPSGSTSWSVRGFDFGVIGK